MAIARIAVLFDAENINCDTAITVLKRLALLGTLPIRRAVGDFSAATLAAWVSCARDNGIELVMQPGLGKGKNAADIRLTIEAMDIAHHAGIDTVALVTHDRDFTPLALRLRNAGFSVLGFALREPPMAFRAACSHFEVIGNPAPKVVAKPALKPVVKPVAVVGPSLENATLARLRQIAVEASQSGPITPGALTKAVIAADPALATQLSGQGKFLKTLVAHGVVERVGSGSGLLVQAPRLQRAG